MQGMILYLPHIAIQFDCQTAIIYGYFYNKLINYSKIEIDKQSIYNELISLNLTQQEIDFRINNLVTNEYLYTDGFNSYSFYKECL